jgi:hypothetical protein
MWLGVAGEGAEAMAAQIEKLLSHQAIHRLALILARRSPKTVAMSTIS